MQRHRLSVGVLAKLTPDLDHPNWLGLNNDARQVTASRGAKVQFSSVSQLLEPNLNLKVLNLYKGA